ncbi:MAG: efflux RND transporter periplasmic adaptor subunit [bacterium]|jgi:membrane fusion protein (multidrug efflux system)|nr:efflux RND transporter periplasmic adaptor subunit [bacterium]
MVLPVRSRPVATAFACTALLTVLVMSATGCSKDGGQPPAAAAGQGAGAGAQRGQPEEQALPIAVEPAATGDIARHYEATATLEAEKEAAVLARVTGVVEKLLVEEGDEVREGQALLVVANDEYRLRLTQAEARTANLRARFERLEAMLAEQLATEEEFQAARSDLASAEADEGLARLNLSYTTVKAPFSGRVTARRANIGQNLAVGTELFVLADFHPLLGRVHVPSKEFARLRAEQPVDLVLDSDGTRLTGHIKLISPVIDPASGTIKLTIEVDDYPAATRPGDFAQVKVVTEKRTGVLLVPREAVLTDKGESVLFVAAPPAGGGDPVAERRVVELGFTDDTHAQVVSGLAAGEPVVVRGQRSLKHGGAVRILAADVVAAPAPAAPAAAAR